MCGLICREITVHEANEQEFVWVVLTILEPELLITKQPLLIGRVVALNFAIVVEVDGVGDQPHVIRSQLHRVSYQFHLAPENVILHFRQECVHFLVSEHLCILAKFTQCENLIFICSLPVANPPKSHQKESSYFLFFSLTFYLLLINKIIF